MALVLQLDPNIEEALMAEARARGLSAEQYAQSLLEEHLAVHNPSRKLTLEEFDAALDAIGQHSDKIPELPPEALTREGIYRDHD